MRLLRLWYRSEWVEPVLLGLLLVMICTGVPMVAHHSRRRADVFRVIQMATGVYVGVFLCSHVLATLVARSKGVETDWSFAAGPTKSLLDARGLGARLIPHYFYSVLAAIIHVGCGLRIVLLQHDVTKVVANRALYALTAVAVVVIATSMAALLGFHVE
jgi:succinate dehydrogenase/fumarate reductase cytochrome b subunit